MGFWDWIIVVFSIFVGVQLTSFVESTRARRDREQRRRDRHDDYQRETLLELQEAVSLWRNNVGEIYDLMRAGKPIPKEIEREHIVLRDKIERLTPNITDDNARERLKAVYDAITAYITKIYPPVRNDVDFDPALALGNLMLYKPVREVYDAIGEIIRTGPK